MSPPPAEQFAARIFVGPALRAQPDRRLVDLVRDGYDAAFEEIVRRYRRPLDRFAAAIVGGRSEDVTQDAFSKALLALRGSEAEIELRPWLYRIVRNTALNDLRDRAPDPAELSEALPGGRGVAAEVEAREELRDLMERLRALPESQRAALVMRELEGLSHEEIAAALGVSGGAARQAIYRARAALRDGLGLLVPLPVLRALAEHSGEASAAGGAIALGGGALKAGMATVLIAGTVGAGVAIEHERGDGNGLDAAAEAPLVGAKHHGGSAGGSATASSSSGGSGESESSKEGDGAGGDGDRSGPGGDSGHGNSSGESGSLGDGSRRDSSGPGPSEDFSSGGSDRSGEDSGDSGSSGPGSNSGSGSGSGDRSGSGSGSGDGDSSGPGSGSGAGENSSSSGSGDSSGSSGSSGSSSGEGSSSGSSGPSSGEVVAEPTPTVSEPIVESTDGSNSGSGSDSSGSSGTSGSGSAESSGLDESS